MTVQVPSEVVPGSPAFTVEVPPDWTAGPAAGVTATFSIDGRPDWSVVISTLRVDAESTLRDLAVRTFARQRAQRPSAVIRTQRTGRFDQRLTYLREVALPDHEPAVSQLQVLFQLDVVGHPDLREVISVVASCPDGDLDELGPLVVGLVASFHPVGS